MTCAPHHLASQGASPQGEALTYKAKIKTYPLSSAYADTFPATVGFFALFSLRRKSEKGESKGGALTEQLFGDGTSPSFEKFQYTHEESENENQPETDALFDSTATDEELPF